MGPSGHAKLSPSASERWISCPASIRMGLEIEVEEVDSPYALEGTAAHGLAEIRASVHFELISADAGAARLAEWESEFPQYVGDRDMENHVEAYIVFLEERLSVNPHSVILLEQRLPTGVPTCWGTSDAVIVSPVHVEIIDFKYGQGVRVEAEGNSQIKLYGVGALEELGDLLGDVEHVTVSIFQPRLKNTSSHTEHPAELRRWRDSLIPIAESALGPDAPFGPSEAACRWCPASGKCRAQLEQVFGDAADYEVDPETLSPEEIAELLAVAPAIKQWLLALEKAALSMAYSEGTPIPGYKVVLSGGRRAIQDEEGAAHALSQYSSPLGDKLDPDAYTKTSLRGIGELEKLLGDEFPDVLGDYVTKNPGRPSLAKESDRRRSISPNTEAQKEFSE